MTDSPLVFRCASCGGVNRVPPARLPDGPKCGRCQVPLDTASKPQPLDDDALQTLIVSSPVPVLVDFWAPWCGPCRIVAPILEEVAREHAGRLVVAKVDTDQHSRTAGGLGVRGIPHFALYRKGELLSQQSGALSKPALAAMVGASLG